MVEIFKTNVHDRLKAEVLTDKLEQHLSDHQVNFDLDDCDRILRVECTTGAVNSTKLIAVLKEFGCWAEALPG